jgi:putative two-component system response regulator
VADVYDVLTSQRPYKAPLSQDAARERLIKGSGASFDPEVLGAFVHLLDKTPDFLVSEPSCILDETSQSYWDPEYLSLVGY